MELFAFGGEAVIGPDMLQLNQGPPAFAEFHLGQAGKREQIFFRVHVANESGRDRGDLPRIEELYPARKAAEIDRRLDVVSKTARAGDAILKARGYQIEQAMRRRFAQSGLVFKNEKTARFH